MQFTDEVDWNVFDFAFLWALLGGAGIACEVALRTSRSLAYRAAVALALATCFMLIVVTGAVGIIGSEDNDANLMYVAMLAVGVIGASAARFRPDGMAKALVTMALAQVLIGIVALTGGMGSGEDADWPRDILGVTAMFAALWLISAWLFHSAAAGHRTRRVDRGSARGS